MNLPFYLLKTLKNVENETIMLLCCCTAVNHLYVLFEHVVLSLIIGRWKSHLTLALVIHHLLDSRPSVIVQVRQLSPQQFNNITLLTSLHSNL